jgi:hypothetical protein
MIFSQSNLSSMFTVPLYDYNENLLIHVASNNFPHMEEEFSKMSRINSTFSEKYVPLSF